MTARPDAVAHCQPGQSRRIRTPRRLSSKPPRITEHQAGPRNRDTKAPFIYAFGPTGVHLNSRTDVLLGRLATPKALRPVAAISKSP